MPVDRRRDGAFGAGKLDTVDERRRDRRRACASANLLQQSVKRRALAELDTCCGAALGQVDIPRQRDLAAAGRMRASDDAAGTAQNVRDRHAWIGGHRHERRVRAVFEEAPHQIGQEIAVASDRRIDAAGGLRQFGEQRFVERLAHAIEPLEFVAFDATGFLNDTRHRERVVGGELRKQSVARREQTLDASHVTKVGHRLAGEDRVIGKAALLRALDLGVPIRAFDQTNRQPPSRGGGNTLDPTDHIQRTLLIGLNRQAKSVPVAKRRIAQHSGDDIERQFEPVGLFGVDRELQIVLARHAGKLDDGRRQLSAHPVARDGLVTRMQCRELDRDARAARLRRVAGARPDGLDRSGIGVEIFVGVRRMCARPRRACRMNNEIRHGRGRATARPRWSAPSRNASRSAASLAGSPCAPPAGRSGGLCCRGWFPASRPDE